MSLPRSTPRLESEVHRAITQEELTRKIKLLGLGLGDKVMVHSSLSQVGWLTPGPEALIRALQDIVGYSGLLVLPTFNHGAPYAPGGSGVFDPQTTASNSGLLSDTFWRMENVARSLSPTHSFAAWGHGARALVEGHEETLTLGPNSPLGRLANLGGKLLHLGTSHAVSTAKHLAETIHQARCLSAPQDYFLVRVEKKERHLPSWRYRAAPCPLTESESLLASRMAPLERVGTVGNALARLCLISDVVEQTLVLLGQGSDSIVPCRHCTIGPSDRAEGDWR